MKRVNYLIYLAAALIVLAGAAGCKKDDPGSAATTGTAKAIIDGKEVDVNWVQLWKDGPKWAVYNVGGTSVGDYGEHYSWGGSTDKSYTDYAPSTVTTDIQYNSTYDTARKKWGDNWQMPTKADFQNLLANCDVELYYNTTYGTTGKKGRLYKGRGDYAGNSVFFPGTGVCEKGSVKFLGDYGYYWNSTPDGGDRACCMFIFWEGQVVPDGGEIRSYGHSVRAVLHQ